MFIILVVGGVGGVDGVVGVGVGGENLVLAVTPVRLLQAFLTQAWRTSGAPPILVQNKRHFTTSLGHRAPSSSTSGVHVVRVTGGELGTLHAWQTHRFGSVNTGVLLLIPLHPIQVFAHTGRIRLHIF